MKTKSLFRALIMSAALAFTSVAIAPATYAKTSKLEKQLQKERDNAYKKIMKEYKAEGWKLANNNSTVEVAVLENLNYYNENRDKVTQETGDVTKCKSLNVGKMSAINNAQNALAMKMQAAIDGYATSLLEADAEETDTEQDKMIAGFTKKLKINLSGCLQESYSIYRSNEDGTYHYRTFFFADKKKCQAAANAAIDKQFKDTERAIEIGNRIKEFVDNGGAIDE